MDWIPAKLRTIRQEFNMTQLELAQASGLSQRDISQLENGRKEGLPKEFIHFLHNRGVDLNWLFTDPEAAEVTTTVAGGKPKKYLTQEPSVALAAEEPAGYGLSRPSRPAAEAGATLRLVAREQLAEYPRRCSEQVFQQQLPVWSLPLPQVQQGLFRAFQLPDAALEPAFASLDWVIAQAEAPDAALPSGALYVVVTRQQVWVQYVFVVAEQPGQLELRAAPDAAPTVLVPQAAVLELWRVTGRLSFQLPPAAPKATTVEASLQDLLNRVQRLEQGR
ncbi:helix-turn-helix domain-containing protein [Hymenobacter chitinivorans]|uniref:Helix-turn-helix protein n=1 Tax=Hymenobacter chitinivorans DSM 11115 TaxID=1121954 RepID=A0A2M9ARU7_9BACT|nr:helix-turn-helix transcriptional regulator [Hymenobacter chitinivorans]PJJ48431.1 helix-turn-helix protein [Hymenobacter chitinivorans DSM 11115]